MNTEENCISIENLDTLPGTNYSATTINLQHDPLIDFSQHSNMLCWQQELVSTLVLSLDTNLKIASCI